MNFQIKYFKSLCLQKKNGLYDQNEISLREEYVTDETWAKNVNFFGGAKGIYVGKERNLKMFIEAIYLITRIGAQWRVMPEKYGY